MTARGAFSIGQDDSGDFTLTAQDIDVYKRQVWFAVARGAGEDACITVECMACLLYTSRCV